MSGRKGGDFADSVRHQDCFVALQHRAVAAAAIIIVATASTVRMGVTVATALAAPMHTVAPAAVGVAAAFAIGGIAVVSES